MLRPLARALACGSRLCLHPLDIPPVLLSGILEFLVHSFSSELKKYNQSACEVSHSNCIIQVFRLGIKMAGGVQREPETGLMIEESKSGFDGTRSRKG